MTQRKTKKRGASGTRQRSGRTFVIRTCADFADVPEEMMDECLREFAIAVRLAKVAKAILEHGSQELGKPTAWKPMESFTWTDDDGADYRVHLNIPKADGTVEDAGSIRLVDGELRYEPPPASTSHRALETPSPESPKP